MMRLDKYLAERTGMTRSESRKAVTKGPLFGRQTTPCFSGFPCPHPYTFHPAVLSDWKPSHRAV